VRDKSAAAQTIAVAASARLPMPRLGHLVAEMIADESQGYRPAVRRQSVTR
jgi:hypothetical protein